MADPRHELGVAAENAVAAWLTGHGWRVVLRRARAPGGGEVDIIALDPDRTLVAIEVRARRSARTGTAATTVDAHRVSRLRRTLASLAVGLGTGHRGLRVDLVTVEPMPETGRWRLQRLPGVG